MSPPVPTSLPFVRSVAHRLEIGSTSDLARELVRTGGFELPLLVWADRQTRGRGRGSNVWWSDEGGLTFTLALDPRGHGFDRPEPAAAVGPIAALTTLEAVEPLLPGVALELRWPNDVECAGRKLCGILPERVDAPDGPRLLIGIGLNVTSRPENAPDHVRASAVSLADLTDHPPSREQTLAAILERFEVVVETLRSEPLTALARRWQTRDSLKDGPVRIATGSKTIVGIARGIDDRGALLVETEGGIVPFFGGQVVRERRSAEADVSDRSP